MTGTTCHVVDAGVDTGPIIEQRVVAVEDDDTEESLHERIKVQERDLLVDVVSRLAREGFVVEGRRVRIGQDRPLGWSHTTGAGGTPPGSDVGSIDRLGASRERKPSGPRRPTRARRDRRHRTRSAPMTAAPSHASITDGRRPIKRALVSVYDKSGLDELARALDARGVASSRPARPPKTIAAAGVPVDAGRGADRLPRVPRRPGQDAPPQGARRHPRRHRATPTMSGSSPTSGRGVRPRHRQPLPLRETVASGASEDECVEQIDIGGPVDGPRRRQEPRERRHRDEPGGIRPVLEAIRDGRLHARPSAGASPPRRSSHTASYDAAVATGWATSSPTERRHRLPGVDGRDLRPRGGASLRREPAPAAPRSTATGAPGVAVRRAAPRQGDVLQQLRRPRRRGARRPRPRRPADRRDHQARQPVRHRRRRDHRGGLRAGPRDRPGERLRRHHRGQPDRHGGHGGGGRSRSSPRSSSRPTTSRRPSRSSRPRRTSASCACPPAWPRRRTRSRRAPSAVACSCRPSTRSTPSCAARVTP